MRLFLHKLLRESLEDDNNSSRMGRKPYAERKKEFIDSIETIDGLSVDKIPDMIEYFGHEGHTYAEDAIEDLEEKIIEYKNFSDPVKLYRVIAVSDKKMINTGDLGEHFTPYEWAIDGDMMMSIGSDNWEDDWVPHIMEVLVPLDQIDVPQTILQNLSFPNEHEINLKNKGRGAKFIKAYKMK